MKKDGHYKSIKIKVFKKHNIRLNVCISNIFIICPPVRTYVYNIYL